MKYWIPAFIKKQVVFQFWLGFVFVWTSLAVNFFQIVILPLRWFGLVNLQRCLNSQLTYMHWILVPAYGHWWASIEVNLHARKSDIQYIGKEKAVVLMNHKSQLDWITTWMVGNSYGVMQNIKAVAKQGLILVPVVGPAFWLNEFILLKRNFIADKDILARSARTYSAFQYNFWLLLFCEGTRFTPEKHKQSIEFAKQNGLKPLKHHLTPRTKGFVAVVEGLRDAVPAVYDVSVCFEGNRNPTLRDYIQGKSIRADIHLRRIPIENVPKDSEKCSEFVHDTYQEKDETCEFYAQHGKFPMTKESDPDPMLVKRIPMSQWSLFYMIFWMIVFFIPSTYLALKIIFSGSLVMYAVTSTIISLFVGVYWLMIGLGTAQSTYGK